VLLSHSLTLTKHIKQITFNIMRKNGTAYLLLPPVSPDLNPTACNINFKKLESETDRGML
jgi:transposase